MRRRQGGVRGNDDEGVILRDGVDVLGDDRIVIGEVHESVGAGVDAFVRHQGV